MKKEEIILTIEKMEKDLKEQGVPYHIVVDDSVFEKLEEVINFSSISFFPMAEMKIGVNGSCVKLFLRVKKESEYNYLLMMEVGVLELKKPLQDRVLKNVVREYEKDPEHLIGVLRTKMMEIKLQAAFNKKGDYHIERLVSLSKAIVNRERKKFLVNEFKTEMMHLTNSKTEEGLEAGLFSLNYRPAGSSNKGLPKMYFYRENRNRKEEYEFELDLVDFAG